MGVDRYEKVGGTKQISIGQGNCIKNSFTVVIVDKGLCNVSAVRFYQKIMNGHDRS